jgi:hypothetical protein
MFRLLFVVVYWFLKLKSYFWPYLFFCIFFIDKLYDFMDYEDPKTIRRKKRYYKYVKKMKLFRQQQKI